MYRTLPVSATFFLAVLAGGCSSSQVKRESSAVAAAREAVAAAEATRAPLAAGIPGESPAPGGLTISDDEIDRYLEWLREERTEHQPNKPIAQEKAAGFDLVLAGLGGADNHGGRMVYTIHHDERSLSGARARYGDAFVDKVLSREDDIAAAMNP